MASDNGPQPGKRLSTRYSVASKSYYGSSNTIEPLIALHPLPGDLAVLARGPVEDISLKYIPRVGCILNKQIWRHKSMLFENKGYIQPGFILIAIGRTIVVDKNEEFIKNHLRKEKNMLLVFRNPIVELTTEPEKDQIPTWKIMLPPRDVSPRNLDNTSGINVYSSEDFSASDSQSPFVNVRPKTHIVRFSLSLCAKLSGYLYVRAQHGIPGMRHWVRRFFVLDLEEKVLKRYHSEEECTSFPKRSRDIYLDDVVDVIIPGGNHTPRDSSKDLSAAAPYTLHQTSRGWTIKFERTPVNELASISNATDDLLQASIFNRPSANIKQSDMGRISDAHIPAELLHAYLKGFPPPSRFNILTLAEVTDPLQKMRHPAEPRTFYSSPSVRKFKGATAQETWIWFAALAQATGQLGVTVKMMQRCKSNASLFFPTHHTPKSFPSMGSLPEHTYDLDREQKVDEHGDIIERIEGASEDSRVMEMGGQGMRSSFGSWQCKEDECVDSAPYHLDDDTTDQPENNQINTTAAFGEEPVVEQNLHARETVKDEDVNPPITPSETLAHTSKRGEVCQADKKLRRHSTERSEDKHDWVDNHTNTSFSANSVASRTNPKRNEEHRVERSNNDVIEGNTIVTEVTKTRSHSEKTTGPNTAQPRQANGDRMDKYRVSIGEDGSNNDIFALESNGRNSQELTDKEQEESSAAAPFDSQGKTEPPFAMVSESHGHRIGSIVNGIAKASIKGRQSAPHETPKRRKLDVDSTSSDNISQPSLQPISIPGTISSGIHTRMSSCELDGNPAKTLSVQRTFFVEIPSTKSNWMTPQKAAPEKQRLTERRQVPYSSSGAFVPTANKLSYEHKLFDIANTEDQHILPPSQSVKYEIVQPFSAQALSESSSRLLQKPNKSNANIVFVRISVCYHLPPLEMVADPHSWVAKVYDQQGQVFSCKIPCGFLKESLATTGIHVEQSEMILRGKTSMHRNESMKLSSPVVTACIDHASMAHTDNDILQSFDILMKEIEKEFSDKKSKQRILHLLSSQQVVEGRVIRSSHFQQKLLYMLNGKKPNQRFYYQPNFVAAACRDAPLNSVDVDTSIIYPQPSRDCHRLHPGDIIEEVNDTDVSKMSPIEFETFFSELRTNHSGSIHERGTVTLSVLRPVRVVDGRARAKSNHATFKEITAEVGNTARAMSCPKPRTPNGRYHHIENKGSERLSVYETSKTYTENLETASDSLVQASIASDVAKHCDNTGKQILERKPVAKPADPKPNFLQSEPPLHSNTKQPDHVEITSNTSTSSSPLTCVQVTITDHPDHSGIEHHSSCSSATQDENVATSGWTIHPGTAPHRQQRYQRSNFTGTHSSTGSSIQAGKAFIATLGSDPFRPLHKSVHHYPTVHEWEMEDQQTVSEEDVSPHPWKKKSRFHGTKYNSGRTERYREEDDISEIIMSIREKNDES